MEREFDVVIVGSGAAASSAAMALRKSGASVAVIDERPFGGTCELRGCDPKKVLVDAAGSLDAIRRYRAFGIFKEAPALDWSALIRFKRTFTDPVPEQREQEYKEAGIVPMRGSARFKDRGSMSVNGDVLKAKHFMLAAGATPLHVAKGDDALLTSDAFLDMEEMPESLVFIGGGYIAFEFAHVAACAGARVTILNESDSPLRGFDQDVVRHLLDTTRGAGIVLELGARVESVERSGDGVIVHAASNGVSRSFEARCGVLAAGRVPNLDELDLPAAGVERTRKGVKVNEYLQSASNPAVFAAGDCADGGGLPLTPVAAYEGEVVATNVANGNTLKPDFRALPSVVYALPPLGQVGVTEEQARAQGLDIEIRSGDMSEWYETRHVAAHAAFFKTVLEKGTQRILGATILGPHAVEQINVLTLAIREGLNARSVSDTLFAYPTGASDLGFLV